MKGECEEGNGKRDVAREGWASEGGLPVDKKLLLVKRTLTARCLCNLLKSCRDKLYSIYINK